MASAKNKHDSSNPENEKLDLFIAPFQCEYSEAITAAREAQETTATHAWKANYRFNVDQHRASVRSAVASIDSMCKTIAASDSFEEAEKDIRDSVKSLADERVRFVAWRSRAVHVYEQAARKCAEVLSRLNRNAADEERNNPLIHRGIVLGVLERVATWPHAEWNEEEGCVVVT